MEIGSLDFALQFRDRAFSPNPTAWEEFSLDTIPLEYPVYGNSDFRSPALEVFQPEDGSRILNLRFKDHEIVAGNPRSRGFRTWSKSRPRPKRWIIGLEDPKLDLRWSSLTPRSPIIRQSRGPRGSSIAERLAHSSPSIVLLS